MAGDDFMSPKMLPISTRTDFFRSLLGVLHTIYTLLDLRNPRRLAPVDPSVAHAMVEFGSQAIGRTHGHVASLDWL